MEATQAFTLILNSKKHTVPSIHIFKYIQKLPTSVSNALVFNDHQYISKAKVSESVSQSFIDYLINDKKPDISIDNYQEYLEISQEFNLLDDFIKEKEKEWGEDLQYFNGLHQSSNQDKSFCETKIARNLDYYLDRFTENFMKEPISTLSNIFFNKECKLTKHNLAYELIKMHYKNTNDSKIFVLLPALDGMKLTEENLQDSIRYKTERFGFMPRFDYSYLSKEVDLLKKNEEEINELQDKAKLQESKIDEIESALSKTIENNEKEISDIKSNHSKEIEDLRKIIEMQNNEIKSIRSDFENEIKACKSSSEKEIESIKSQCEDEIKACKSSNEKEIESIKSHCENEIRSVTSNYQIEIQSIRSGYENKIRTISEQFNNEIESLKQNLRNQKNKMNSIKRSLGNKIDVIESTSNENKGEITSLKTQQESGVKSLRSDIDNTKSFLFTKIIESTSKSIPLEPSLTENGILCKLKEESTDIFNPPFIASQSSNDIYNIIDSNSNDEFSTNSDVNFFIKFELEKAAQINGIVIHSADIDFPKSFDIEIDGEVVKSIKEANELNGKYKKMTINFPSKSGKIVRFVQNGPNWDKGNNFLLIKTIELLSPEPKYSKGIFTTLIEESKHKDPRRCGVNISSTRFDFNSFHLINTKNNIWTFNEKNSWFQVELTRGFAILTGFRLKRDNFRKLRSYKIIATDDDKKPDKSWTELFKLNEEVKDENNNINVYNFPPSPPIRFIRIIQTGPNWNNDNNLKFYHFELFGTYYIYC